MTLFRPEPPIEKKVTHEEWLTLDDSTEVFGYAETHDDDDPAEEISRLSSDGRWKIQNLWQ